MNKEQLIESLKESIKSGAIKREEINTLFDSESVVSASNPESSLFEGKKRFTATNILYLIGGLILLIGIGTLISRFWNDLSSVLRITVTLGMAVVAFISGVLLRNDKKALGISVIMQVISGILFPIGIFVTLNEAGLQNIGAGWIAIVSVILAVLYIISLLLFRSIVFSFYSIIFGTWAIYSFVDYALVQSVTISSNNIYEYLTIAIGLGYMFLSSYVKDNSHKSLSRSLDFFGSIGIYSSILILGDYSPNQSIFWEIIGILALIGGMFYSGILHNKTILKTTSLFIFIFICKFTSEYFVNSIGWPISLVILGIIFIALGYFSISINKKFGKN